MRRNHHADDQETPSPRPSRRAVLTGMIAGFAGLPHRTLLARQDDAPRGAGGEDAEIAGFENEARKAGLGPVLSTRTEHFLSLGDAPLPFQSEALDVCEPLGNAFLAHFHACGFEVAYPARRLTVVILKDEHSYAKLLGEAPGKDVGGHYDLGTNRLVIFDFRPGQEGPVQNARRVNLFTLVHETAHQLTFNTGMLSRRARLPLAVLEGLATYVEMWRPRVKNSIGGVNLPRLEALRQSEDWISIADLLADDKAFQPETDQLAYAESWLLVHYLLRSRTRQPRFRSYLAAAQATKKPGDPRRIAEEALGSLDRLDREVRNDARLYLRR